MSTKITLEKLAGNKLVSTGSGSVDSGCLRVALASGTTSGNVNIQQINSHTVAEGNGTVGNGVQRVAIASDNLSIPVTVGNFSNLTTGSTGSPLYVNISQVGANAITTGTGVAGAGTQRVVLASGVNYGVNISQYNGTAPSSGEGLPEVGCPRIVKALQNPYAVQKYQNTSGNGMYRLFSVFNGSGGGAATVYKPEGFDASSVGNVTTAGTIKLSSSDNGDAGLGILIAGYDGSGNFQTEDVTLNGRTSVTTTNSYLCLTRMCSDDGAGILTGKVYAYDSGATVTSGVPNRAMGEIINTSIQRANLNWILLPIGKSLYIYKLRVSLVGNTTATHKLVLRKYNYASNTAVGYSSAGTEMEWTVTGTQTINYNGALQFTSTSGSGDLFWFEAGFLAADSGARMLLECSFIIDN